jgi:hypothetical protein
MALLELRSVILVKLDPPFLYIWTLVGVESLLLLNPSLAAALEVSPAPICLHLISSSSWL